MIKKLIFKGLEKKEQILFKSFLNLAKNDIAYEIELIQNPDAPVESADIVIADESCELPELTSLTTLIVGEDPERISDGYLLRPVQWSDFKEGLIQVSLDNSPEQVEIEQRTLPSNLALEIDELEQLSGIIEDGEDVENDSRSFDEASDYNFSLDKISLDDQSFTNSEYQKVADDVKGFNEDGVAVDVAPIMLVSDDESSNTNSVLVIETNSLDAWDMSESEFEEVSENSADSSVEHELPDLGAKERKVVQSKLDAGTAIDSVAEMWMVEQEVLAGSNTLFYVLPSKLKVYSTREPGKWINALRMKDLTSVALTRDWRPKEELKEYPLDRLIWINALVGRNTVLDDGASDNHEFMLKSWPHFELLELDNALLKITTLLFVGPESAYSLMQKTGAGRGVVYGMLNACKELGMLVSPDKIHKPKYKTPNQEEGMFGKIKDVFS